MREYLCMIGGQITLLLASLQDRAVDNRSYMSDLLVRKNVKKSPEFVVIRVQSSWLVIWSLSYIEKSTSPTANADWSVMDHLYGS